MSERYAIYYAPDPDSDLWVTAAQWLGRDAATGELLYQDVPQGIDPDLFRDVTITPCRYGFHATLKAPMFLAADRSVADLLDTARVFAANHAPVEIGKMEVRELSGFLAIMPRTQSGSVTQFAADCVAHFEPFRAPTGGRERAERIASGLTSRQIELFDQYGYPYVMEEFHLHLTLTDRLGPGTRGALFEAAKTRFDDALDEPYIIENVAVYREAKPGEPFMRLADFRLTGDAQEKVAKAHQM